MATYYEYKKFLGEIFRNRDVKDNDDDIIIDINTRRKESDECTKFIIKNTELTNIFNEISRKSETNLELFDEYSYEIAIDLNNNRFRDEDNNTILCSDSVNKLSYEIGPPSLEYCNFLLIKLIDKINTVEIKSSNTIIKGPSIQMKLFMNLKLKSIEDSDLDFEKALQQIVSVKTLKIKNRSKKELGCLKDYKTGFEFNIMYKTNYSLNEYTDVYSIFRINHKKKDTININEFDTFPAKRYTKDVVDYYKLAVNSNDSYIKFISYYHVIEYFYDEIFKKKIVEELQEKITNPNFSYKNEDKIFELVKVIQKKSNKHSKDGQGNELESLKYVLKEFIKLDALKERIQENDFSALKYYKGNSESFCKTPIINFDDVKSAIPNIAKRIYSVRNALIHSKSGRNNERYKHFEHEKTLEKEIALVKSVAELIIIGSSNII